MVLFRIGCLMVAAVSCLSADTAIAADFRITSKIYADNDREPLSENLTLFHGDVVYDFMLTGTEEIVVFDPSRGRVILLDPERKVKTEIQLSAIKLFTESVLAKADPQQTEMLNPKLESSFDAEEGWLTLASKAITYQAKGIKPTDANVADRYRRFADAQAQLNAMRQRGFPPYARIKLNDALVDRGLLPQQVKLTLAVKKGLFNKKNRYRSEHEAIWSLSRSDRDRIERAGLFQAQFQPVRFKQYVQPAKVANSGR